MANLSANLRELLEWLDRVSPLLETQIVAGRFELHARPGADAQFCRD
jgi:hypothetical protein